MRSSCAWLIGLLAVATAPGVSRAQPPAAAGPALPVWPGHVESGAVQVDALDVDADALRAVLAPARLGYIIVTTPRLVSGRVRVAKRAAALAAMIAHEPALAIAPRPLRGGGAKVSFDFRGAPTRDLYRVLAQVLNANVVALAPSVDVTIRVHGQPAKGVLAETARVTGAVIDRPARGVMVVRPAGAPPTPRLPTGGGRLRLVARGVAPGRLVAAVAALDGPPAQSGAAPACGGGQPVELRLTDVATNTAVALIGLAGQVDTGAPRCALPPLAQAPTPAMRLVATLARGATRVAVVELGGAAAMVTAGVDGWEIGDGWASRGGPDADATWRVYGDLEATATATATPPARRGTRLAAPVIDGATRVAIVEVDGQFQTWIEGRAESHALHLSSAPPAAFTVAPGEVQIQGGATLRLAPRAP